MFVATDAKEYGEIARWLMGHGDTAYTQTRPLLYPALIALPYELGGIYGIWLLQVAAWILSLDLLFSACYRWTNKYMLSFLVAALFAANISAIAISFHALTEMMTILGLAVLVWLIARFKNDYHNVRFGNYMVLLFALLTLIKPVFYYPFLISVLVFLVFNFKQYRSNLKKAVMPLVAVGLILIQMSLVKVRHDAFTVSTISHKTFVDYLLTQGYATEENLEFEEALARTRHMSSKQQVDYIRAHFQMYWDLFNQNVDNNIHGEPVYLNLTSRYQRVLIDTFNYRMNLEMRQWHERFLMLISTLLAFLLFARKWKFFIPLLISEGILFYYLFATGLSFWQGDRLTLPVIAIWPILYVIVIFELAKWTRYWFIDRFGAIKA